MQKKLNIKFNGIERIFCAPLLYNKVLRNVVWLGICSILTFHSKSRQGHLSDNWITGKNALTYLLNIKLPHKEIALRIND